MDDKLIKPPVRVVEALEEVCKSAEEVCKSIGLTYTGVCRQCGFEGLQDANAHCLDCLVGFEEVEDSQD